MENMSSYGRSIDNGNTQGENTPVVISGNRGPNPDQIGNSNERPYLAKPAGDMGPGVGSAKRMNSDGQMPVNPGCCT